MSGYKPVLKPVRFTVGSTDVPLEGDSSWIEAGIHKPLSETADIIAAHLLRGDIDIKGRNLLDYTLIRIWFSTSRTGTDQYSWSACIAPEMNTWAWYPITVNGILQELISKDDLLQELILSHLSQAAELSMHCSNETAGTMWYFASFKDLSNHQRLALEHLISVNREAEK